MPSDTTCTTIYYAHDKNKIFATWNGMKWNDTKLHDKNSSIYQDKILIETIAQAHNF